MIIKILTFYCRGILSVALQSANNEKSHLFTFLFIRFPTLSCINYIRYDGKLTFKTSAPYLNNYDNVHRIFNLELFYLRHKNVSP